MPGRPASLALEPETRRKLGIELFNYVWTLLEKADRTEGESGRMIDPAHASRFFWEEVGEPANHARGEWQIARVYATVGRAEPALHHAHRCLEICEMHGIGDFDLAYAYEALARAHGWPAMMTRPGVSAPMPTRPPIRSLTTKTKNF